MSSVIHTVKTKILAFIVLISLLGLAACGSSSATTSSATPTAAPKTINIGSKLDTENQLLAEMYGLLLQKAGYSIKFHIPTGDSPATFTALQSGALGIYPEFTATGLNTLKVPSAYDPAKDYQTVKQGFEKQYGITWLDPSPLNDGYALCMTKDQAQARHITSISDLALQVSSLKLESPSDGTPFVDNLQQTYKFSTKSFKLTQTVNYAVGIKAVAAQQADVAVCYTTDGSIVQQNFIFLQDDKHGFPEFHPAPIVRDDVLKQYPDIPSILNPLAPKLTTEVSIELQKEVADKKASGTEISKAIEPVAKAFLQKIGLL